MKIAIDFDKCHGHGRCYDIAPGMFDSDDEGYSVLLHDGVVPAGLEKTVELAIANCPESAISITEA